MNLENGEPVGKVGQFEILIDKLIYFIVTISDNAFTISMISQFMHVPRTSHTYMLGIPILRYLKGSSHRDIWYKKLDDFAIVGNLDVD